MEEEENNIKEKENKEYFNVNKIKETLEERQEKLNEYYKGFGLKLIKRKTEIVRNIVFVMAVIISVSLLIVFLYLVQQGKLQDTTICGNSTLICESTVCPIIPEIPACPSPTLNCICPEFPDKIKIVNSS